MALEQLDVHRQKQTSKQKKSQPKFHVLKKLIYNG